VESNKTRKSAVVIIAVSVVAIAAAVFGFSFYKSLHTMRLSQLVRSDLPMLDVRLQFINLKGEEISPAQSKLVDSTERAKQPAPETSDESCPELTGGDTSSPTRASEKDKRGENCSKTATWKVKRHPIAFSLYFQGPQQIFELFERDSRARELFQSKFFQGIFSDFLHSTSVRAEDLHLEGLDGMFLQRFLREAMAAHGELHYDMVHGKKGFVFTFVRDEAPFVSKALPIMARALARSGYRTAKLKEPIIEMHIGVQRLFLTQFEGRVYLANGLEGLLNVMESLRPPAVKLPQTPLVLDVRTEAFVDKLLPVMVGAPTWDVVFGLGLSEEAPGSLEFTGGKFASHMRPKVFKGVLAGIPHDVFAAAVTSAYLPPEMTVEEWQLLATNGPSGRSGDGPEEAGFALLWDLNSGGTQLTDIGVVIANQKTPDNVDEFKRYFADQGLTAECGGGTLFLAATSDALLTRMKESCSGQSLSVLDWEKGGKRKEYEAAQFFLFMNPGAGLRELSLAGGAKSGDEGNGDFEPEWKQQYEKAKEAMRAGNEKVFAGLPIVAYAGSGVRTEDVVRLKGFTVKQGASR
jgi:hypothetical protein